MFGLEYLWLNILIDFEPTKEPYQNKTYSQVQPSLKNIIRFNNMVATTSKNEIYKQNKLFGEQLDTVVAEKIYFQ